MINEKRLLKNYFLWFLCFIITMFIGIIRTYAITFTDFTDVHSNTILYVGYSDSGNPISWPYNNSTLYQSNIISLDYVVNTNITGGVHYEFETHMLGNYIINNPIYSVVDANGNSCLTDSYYLNFINGSYPRWDFQCPSNSTGFTIHIQQSNSTRLFNDGYMGWGSAILSKTTTPISSSSNDTEEIINNNNYNTNQIIDNQNQNTDRIIEENNKNFNTCRDSYNLLDLKDGSYSSNGIIAVVSNGEIILNGTASTNAFVDIALNTNLNISLNDVITFSANNPVANNNIKFRIDVNGYLDTTLNTINKVNTINVTYTIFTNGVTIRIQSGTTLSNFKLKPQIQKGTQSTDYEPFGEEICTNKLDSLNDTLNDDDTDGAVSDASDFFSDFTTDTFGLTSIITAPLNLIQSLSSSSCSQLELPLPYLNNKKLILPCMTTIYSQYFGSFFTMYQTITYGIIAYWVIVRIFNLVKDFKNPEHDEIEVVDL